MRRVASGALIVLLTIWAMCLFDISRPSFPVMPESKQLPDTWQALHPMATRILDRPLPAGMYISSLLEASLHARLGHVSYLLGETSRDGWWYYFPVVATSRSRTSSAGSPGTREAVCPSSPRPRCARSNVAGRSRA